MQNKQKDLLKIKNFTQDLTSQNEEEFLKAIDFIPELLTILEMKRFCQEGLYLIKKYSDIHSKKIILLILEKIFSLRKKFKSKKEKIYFQNFFLDFLLVREFEINLKAKNYLVEYMTNTENIILYDDFLNNYYCSKKKIKIFLLDFLNILKYDIINQILPTLSKIIIKLLDDEDIQIRKLTYKLYIKLLEIEKIRFSKEISKKILNLLELEKEGFLKMYCINLYIYLGYDNLEKKILSILKNKDVNIINNFLVNLSEIKRFNFSEDKIIDLLSEFLYEKEEKDIIILIINNITEIISTIKINRNLKKFYGNIINILNNSKDEEIKFLIFFNFLKSSKILTQENTITILLSPVLNLIREENDLINEEILCQIKFFFLKIGVDICKETLIPFLKSILLKNSLNLKIEFISLLKLLLKNKFDKDLIFFLKELLLDDYIFIGQKSFEVLSEISLIYKENFFEESFLKFKDDKNLLYKKKIVLLNVVKFVLKNSSFKNNQFRGFYEDFLLNCCGSKNIILKRKGRKVLNDINDPKLIQKGMVK